MSDAHTLIHETDTLVNLSSSQTTTKVGQRPQSTYYVEAPSTFNELPPQRLLEHQFDDPRSKRFALAPPFDRYLLHNFITHLLEAAPSTP